MYNIRTYNHISINQSSFSLAIFLRKKKHMSAPSSWNPLLVLHRCLEPNVGGTQLAECQPSPSRPWKVPFNVWLVGGFFTNPSEKIWVNLGSLTPQVLGEDECNNSWVATIYSNYVWCMNDILKNCHPKLGHYNILHLTQKTQNGNGKSNDTWWLRALGIPILFQIQQDTKPASNRKKTVSIVNHRQCSKAQSVFEKLVLLRMAWHLRTVCFRDPFTLQHWCKCNF